ncbi:MAG: GNAT family N-acetyltransferase [Candidatus Omnitrophota bacterium]
MTAVFIWIKHNYRILWRLVEAVNSFLLGLFFGRKLEGVKRANARKNLSFGYLRILRIDDAERVACFLECVTEAEKKVFDPHKFGLSDIKKVLQSRGYLAFGFFDNDKLAGYFFLRLFFLKKAFIGRYLTEGFRGKGIGKESSIFLCNVGENLGFKIYSTISKDNFASLGSHRSTGQMTVVKELPNNYVLVRMG